MTHLRILLRTMEDFLGKDTVSPIRLHYEQKRASGRVLLPPPGERASEGEYKLGEVVWDDTVKGKFGLREEELPQHIAIFGRTGGGKTNCAHLLLQELRKKDKAFLVFDWKQSYRVLCDNREIRLLRQALLQRLSLSIL